MAPTVVVVALVGRREKGRKWALPLAVLAGALITVGLTKTSGAAPASMPFLSPRSPPPQPGYVYPAAPQGTRVISYTYNPLYRLTSIVAIVSGFESSKQTAPLIDCLPGSQFGRRNSNEFVV